MSGVLTVRVDGRLSPRNLRSFCENREDALVGAVVAPDIFFDPILVFLQGLTLGFRLDPIIKVRLAHGLDPILSLWVHSSLLPPRRAYHIPVEPMNTPCLKGV